MKLTWYGHSCFKAETGEGSVVFDPYRDGSVKGLGPVRMSADLVLCSHGHADHNGPEIVTLSGKQTAFTVDYIDTYHDEVFGTKRGPNRIYIIRAEDMTIVHMGDIGCALEAEQIEKLHGCDVLLIPVGGFFTIDAAQAAEMVKQLEPRLVFPMHYRRGPVGYDTIAEVDEFLALSDNVTELASNEFTVTKAASAQTVVLTL